MNDQQSLGGINVNITAQYDQFYSGVTKVERKLDELSSKFSSQSSKISAATVALGNIVATVVSKVASTVASNIDYATKRLDSLNRFPIVMENLGIATSEAKDAINALASYTLGLPTTLNDAAEKVQYFTSATGNVWQSIKIFQALNDAVLSGAQTAEVQSTAIYQWSQAIVRGSFDIEREFNALVVANAKAVNEISEQLLGTGKDFNDLWNALKSGKVTVRDMVNAMVYLDENGSGGLEGWSKRAQNSVAGIDTAITRLKTNIGKAVAVVGEEIGWKNIYTFVNNVGDAIYKAGQYVAAFVRILKEAVAWVSVLFGGSGSTSEIVKETGSAANNTAGIASGASSAADSLDDAAGSAKKLHKQLASFDEMNVLTEPTSSGSGSGGGGGGSGGYDFNWDTDAFESAGDKIAKLVDKLKKKFQELFGTFDFEKIAKAFKKFYDDVKKLLEPLGRILADIWNDYLSPFINWAGNELLPAFLNALGGAIALVGEVIGQFWDTFLKPFIDFFLVPIAKWTGGVIVTVLNAIGDALHWLVEQQPVIDLLTGLAVAITTVKVAQEAWTLAQSAWLTVTTTANMMTGAMTTSLSTLAFQIGASTNNLTLMSNGVALASTGLSGFGTLVSGMLETVFSPMTIAILAIVAAYEAFRVIQEYNTLKTMEAELAEKNFLTTQEAAERAATWYNEAIERQRELKDELRDATANVTSAELDLLHAQETVAKSLDLATTIANKYGMTVDEAKAYVATLDIASGDLTDSDRELAEAIKTLENSQDRENDAIRRLSDAKDVQTQKTVEATNMAWKEIMALKEQQIQAQLSEGKYEEVSKSLQDLADSSGEFQLANGEMVKFTTEDMKNMAELIGDHLADIDEANGKAWKSVWEKAEWSVDKLRTLTAEEYRVAMEGAGENFNKGVAQGIQNSQWRVAQSARGSARAAKDAFNAELNIKSPSRVMRESGQDFGEGVELGIKDRFAQVKTAAADLAKLATAAFENNFGLDAPDLSNFNVSAMSNLTGDLELDLNKAEPVAVQVNIGEETLIDKIIDGLNDRAYMQNRAVVTV